MKSSRFILLPLFLLVAGCGSLGTGDLATVRAVSQGRYDQIETVALVIGKLEAQPMPSNLTPAEQSAWNEQTTWLTRTRTRLLTFRVGLKRALDTPAPGGGIDGAIATAQIVADFAKLSEDFGLLMQELTVESQADNERIARASAGSGTPRDTAKGDTSKGGQIALSGPLKTRHDATNSAISSLS